jgi:hypothetical protein
VASDTNLVQGLLAVASGIPENTIIGQIDGTAITLTKELLSSLTNASINFYSNFNVDQWTQVEASSLSGVDRTMGFYVPTVNMPGLSLPLLIDGIDYPGVQVDAPDFNQNTGFDVGNYDINPFDNISYDAEGRPTYDPGILDANYASAYLDPYLGTRPTDINVDGGVYIGPYSSHAPEELIPGSEFDTLDLRVYTRPGSDWLQRGHGFPSVVINYTLSLSDLTLSFANLLPYTALVMVANQTQGLDLHLGTDYLVNYVTQIVTVIPSGNVQVGDVISITAYEIGGGNQLYKNVYNGADVGNTITVPVAYYQIDGSTPQIQEFVIFVNGVVTTNYTYEATGDMATTVTFGTSYTFTDSIALYVLAPTVIAVGDTPIDYSWSAPQTQIIPGVTGVLSYTLDNNLSYENSDCLIVTVNGVRAKTAAGIRHIGDGSTAYTLPERIGVDQSIIVDNEVFVYVNGVAQILGVDFVLETSDVTPREVIFATEPEIGSTILIYVTTNTQCYVNDDQIVFNPLNGLVPNDSDIIAVTTWNDTRQQQVLSQCFVGPVTTGVVVNEPYDSTDFDVGTITGSIGSYDYTDGATTTTNNLFLDTIITDPSRLWVSLNGRRLFNNQGFTVSGAEVILTSGVMRSSDVVMITQFTNNVVPESMAFRIFQDMRGVQATYRITPATTTTTTEAVAIIDDIIYVANASALPESDFATNVWGVVTIGGERIMYRDIDFSTNTISSLLRGTAGTAADSHDVGNLVYNMGRDNLLPLEFQNYVDTESFLGNGTQSVFTSSLVVNNANYWSGSTPYDSTPFSSSAANGAYDPGLGSNSVAVEVYLGGTLQTSGYTLPNLDPVVVIFTTAPADGTEITIVVYKGHSWYNPGVDTASDGVPLQETNNAIARFLRGVN